MGRVSNFQFLISLLLTLSVLLACALPPAVAQAPGPGTVRADSTLCTGSCLPAVLEAIQRARVTTRILYVTAHPDDEASGVLTYLARGLGADVALLAITRGEGGQNALGPEMAPQLGILRTAELEAATRTYGTRLFFTRAPDFGYSKTTDETLRIWGDATLGDMVQVIRTFRPHIVVNHWAGVRSGHGHHQAAGLLTPRAVEAAADPNAFTEQLASGMKPWRAQLVRLARNEEAGAFRIPTGDTSPIWGESYGALGRQGFANHRTQGIAGFLGSPFFRRSLFLAGVSGPPPDARDLASPLTALGEQFPAAKLQLDPTLGEAAAALAAAKKSAEVLDWPAAQRSLAAAGRAVAGARVRLPAEAAGVASELRWELDRVEECVNDALARGAALEISARADRSEIVAGETFTVRVETQRRADALPQVETQTLVLPGGWSVAKEEADANGVRVTVSAPGDAKPPADADAWMHPWPRPLVRAKVRATLDGYSFDAEAPVVALRATSTSVETLPLRLVPAVTLSLEPHQFIVPVGQPAKPLELLARVHSYAAGAAKVTAGLDVPAGWRVQVPASLDFAGPGDQLVRFMVTPPARLVAGKYELNAWASVNGEKFRTSLEPLPTLPTELWSEPARATVRAFELNVPRGLRVGYIAAENDPIPELLRQVGVEVELLGPVQLAFGDLRKFDAIAIGIRAYELRADLARANQRLLDYAATGGTLVVQYQRDDDFNRLKPAPFPASVGQPTIRITDETAPVKLLLPQSPVLNFPNKISLADFDGWVQERGLYFWGQYAPEYQFPLGMRDPGESADAVGAIAFARTGKGFYIYTGLSFFRQLPEGVPGAYRLFLNLLSQSRATPSQ